MIAGVVTHRHAGVDNVEPFGKEVIEFKRAPEAEKRLLPRRQNADHVGPLHVLDQAPYRPP